MNVRRQPSATSKPVAKQSWRKGAEAKPKSDKRWSSSPTKPDVLFTRSFKLFASFALLLATMIGVIVYLTRTDDMASMVVMPVDNYQYPWAPNGWAQEDAEWLEDRLEKQEKKINVIVAKEIPEQKSVDDWLSFQLDNDDFVAGGPGGGVIWRRYGTAIIYLSAHFSIDQDGQPCVMSPTALSTDAWQAATPVRLQKVLDTVSNHPKLQASQIRGIRKLVVLDLGKQPASMILGRCNDALHAAIQRVVEAQTDRNMAVVLSCKDNQRAWTAPEIGGSNFGIWFTHGLSGSADKNRNGRIQLKELLDYLKTQVNLFANSHRAAYQEPVCFFPTGNPIDFDIAFSKKSSDTETPSASMAKSIETKSDDDLARQWTEFENWKENELGYDAWLVSEVNNRLVRADQLLLAGPSHDTQLKQEIEKTADLMASPPRWPISVAGQSRAKGIEGEWKKLSADIAKPITDWLDQVAIDGKVPEKPPAVSEELAHVAAWSWLMNKKDTLNAQGIQRIRRMQTEAIPDSSQAVLSRDRALLRSLVERFNQLMENSQIGDERSTAERLKAMVRILDAHRQLEDAFDIQDPRLGSWLATQKGLLQSYLKAVDYWFVGSSLALEECDQLLGLMFGDSVDSRTSKLKQAADERKKLETGWKLHDEMALSLPVMLWTFDNQSSLFSESRRRLRDGFPKLVDGLKELHVKLDSATKSEGLQFESLRKLWDDAKISFLSSLMKLVPENEVDAASCRDILLWIDQPAISRIDKRSVLRKGLVDHLRSNLKESNTNETKLPLVAFEFPTLENWEENKAVDLLREVMQLEWTNDESSSSLDGKYGQLHRKVWGGSEALLAEGNRLADMGVSIRRAWQAQLAAPWLAQHPANSASANSKCPTRAHWASSAQLALLAMADFAREDFWVLPSDANLDESTQYFAKIAQNCMAAAGSKGLADGNIGAEIFKEREASLQKTSIASRDWKDELWSSVPKQPLEGVSVPISVAQPKKNQPPGIAMLEHPLAAIPESVSADMPTNIKIDLGRITSSAVILKANFRGRSTEHNLSIKRPTAELELAWNIKKADVTKIRVSADQPDCQVLFVLDCSRSLDPATLDKAKTTILEILDRLPITTEVGLVAFGHSASWMYAKSDEVDFNRRFFQIEGRSPNELNPKRTPENDVDLLVPFEKLSDKTIAKFRDKLDPLEPFGFTPLYYAMKFSLDEQAKRKGLKQNLVVITDGNINVTRGSDGAELGLPLRPPFIFSKQAISSEIRRLRESLKLNLQLDVIAYQFKNASSGELEELAGKEHFHIASDEENELLRVVRKILGLRSFNVRVEKEGASPTDFGFSKPIQTGKPTSVRLAITDTQKSIDFVAIGGEFLDAKYDADRNQLRFSPLGEEFEDFCDVPIGDQKVKIGTLFGDRIGGNQYIRVAIQSADPQQPSVRPRRLWLELEVQPRGSKNMQTLGVSDVEWETDRFAPVFRIPILNGVPERIRVWLSFEDAKTASLSIPFTKWDSKGGSKEFPDIETPIGETESKYWVLSWGQPITSRLAWSLDPPPNDRIEYTVGSMQRQRYRYRKKPDDDVEIRIEKMPAADRPNTGGWSTSEWLKVPKE